MDTTYAQFIEQAGKIQIIIDEISARFNNLCTFSEAAPWHSDIQALLRVVEAFHEKVT